MKAVVYQEYGSPVVREIDPPTIGDTELLVRVHAASVNPMDWHFLTGTPYPMRAAIGWLRPTRQRLGVDFSGTVVTVGSSVTQLQPGDEVFGAKMGAFAEYVCATEERVVPKPPNATFEQAAAVPVAGITALQALRDQGQVRPGHRVLITGASGGVGTFAVQIAKSLGAHVTGVCRTSNVDLVRSIGADRVIDYTREDFTRGDPRYDVMLDIAGNRSWSDCRRVLDPHARVVIVGGPKTNPWLDPFAHIAQMHLGALGGGRKVVMFVATVKRKDLLTLKELIEAGAVTPVIDRRYELSEAPQALAYLGQGHTRGKVVLTVAGAA